MSQASRVLIGILTGWPFIYIVFFFFVLYRAVGSFNGSATIEGPIWIIFVLHLLTIFVIVGLEIFYILHAFRNPALDRGQAIIWTILLVTLNIFVMPVYWFKYLRHEPEVLRWPQQ